MKIFLSAIFALVSVFSFAQNDKTITVNSLDQEQKALYKSVYLYPEFTLGNILYKDQGVSEGRLNYNRVTGQMLFIGAKGDTLAFAHPETMAKVSIGKDTFCFFESTFLQKITDHPGVNLYVKRSLKLIGKEKKGAYGTYSQVSAANSNTTYTNDDEQSTAYLAIDENMIYKERNDYYFSDAFTNFFPANKSHLFSLFSSIEKELKAFFNVNKLSFDKREDLCKMLEFAQSKRQD